MLILNKIFIFIFTSLVAFNSLSGQNINLTIGNVDADGYAAEIIVPVTLSNQSHSISGVQFDLSASPNDINISGVSTAGSATSFASHYNTFNDGTSRVILYDGSGLNGLSPGEDEIILNLHFDGSNILSAVLDLNLSDIIISDISGNILPTLGTNGSITIGNVVFMSASADTGDVNESVSINLALENDGIVSGLQLDLFDSPNYVTVVGVSAVGRAEGFSASFNEINNGRTRIVLFSQNNEDINPGSGAILKVSMLIHEDAYADQVGINFENIKATDDLGGLYWISDPDSGLVEVHPGYIEEAHNLAAVDGLDGQVQLTWDAPFGPIPEQFSEDFETGNLPNGWSVITNGNGWYITENGSSNYWTIPNHTFYAVSNDDGYNGEDTQDNDGNDYLVLPSINMAGATNVTINFASFFTGEYGQTATIAVSTDGGVTFADFESVDPAATWAMSTVDISQFAGNQNVIIAFHSNDNGGWASGWAVDDIIITFSNRSVTRHMHFELTEIGNWSINVDKNEFIKKYPGGIPFNWRVNLQNPSPPESRPVEIDEYKIFRSEDENNFENIAEVNGNTLTFLDQNVQNSNTYYYYVTAVYPGGYESGPTDIVSATPVEWVDLSISNGNSLSGQLDTIDISIQNESQIGLFYFEIMDYPNVINPIDILSTERTESANWELEITDLGGNIAITGINVVNPLEPGSGPVCRAVVYPISDEELTVNLSFVDAGIQDENFVALKWIGSSSTYNVGIETQYLMQTSGHGYPGSNFTSSIILQNTQPVYGIQLDIKAVPYFISGTNVEFNPLLNFSNWDIGGNMVGEIYRLEAFTLSNPINPGTSHIFEITYAVHNDAPLDTSVLISIEDAVIADVNTLPMIVDHQVNNIYIGQPPVNYSIENVLGELIPGGTGSFEIHMQNTENVFIIELYIEDIPNYCKVINISGLNRYSSGIISDGSGENEDGVFYFLGYDFSTDETGNSVGIIPGDGAILKVDVEFNQNLQNPSSVLMFQSSSSGDVNASPIMTMNSGFGQFTGSNLKTDKSVSLPDDFLLHQNFPNPFNPITKISYDLLEVSNVKLEIYDLRGRLIKRFLNKEQHQGAHYYIWDATNYFGDSVSAGVYICRLEVGGKIFNRKMVFLK